MRILIVEDDDNLADWVSRGLRQAGHLVERCADGRQGLLQATTEIHDVIVLDRMLPRVDGLKLLSVLRAAGDSTPVLMLSALGDVDEKIRGLRAGSDDYLAKPFDLAELLARVQALGRRAPALAALTTTLRVGDLEIDLLGHQARRDGRRISLTSREFRILEHLARHAGRVVTRLMLLESVWEYRFDPQTNIIDQHVSKLRQKISAPGEPPLIHTIRGAGYVMRAD